MELETKIYTLADVFHHNQAEDCWVVINAKVYNVTSFLRDHPGGDEVLLAAAGTDASEQFEDAGHGSSARSMMNEYYMGELDPSEPRKTPKPREKQPTSHPETTAATLDMLSEDKGRKHRGLIDIKLLAFLLPLAILGLAVVIGFFD